MTEWQYVPHEEPNGKSNYSPVAAWPTVRSFLSISLMKNWITASIDFTQAFAQAKLPEDDPAWMHVPRGFQSTLGHTHCLKLDKSLYGLKAAPKLWFEHCAKVLKKLGMKQSKYDECLWHGHHHTGRMATGLEVTTTDTPVPKHLGGRTLCTFCCTQGFLTNEVVDPRNA